MKDTRYTCRCTKCGAAIDFEGKQLGETVACPACNQDTKLFAGAERRTTPIERPTVHYILDYSGPTLCCHKQLTELPPTDRVTDDPAGATCKTAAQEAAPEPSAEAAPEQPSAPPVMQRSEELKQDNGLALTLLCAFCFLLACMTVLFVSSCISTQCPAISHETLTSSAGQEYGLRDHMTTRVHRSREEVMRMGRQLGMNDVAAADFAKGYDIGWNLVGRY